MAPGAVGTAGLEALLTRIDAIVMRPERAACWADHRGLPPGAGVSQKPLALQAATPPRMLWRPLVL